MPYRLYRPKPVSIQEGEVYGIDYTIVVQVSEGVVHEPVGVHDGPVEGVDDFVVVEVTGEGVSDRNGDGGGGAVPCLVGCGSREGVGTV